MNDLISVIIPTYGRSGFLINAVHSILNQTYENFEIIIVDDNGIGTDDQVNTFKKIESVLEIDRRIKYIPHDINLNGSAARNTGIKNSNGKYICFLDDDDEFEKEKLDLQYKRIQKSGYKACYCGHTRIKNKEIISEYTPSREGNILFELLLHKIDACTGSTLMIDRSLLEQVKGFDVSFRRHQDYEFIARIAYHTNIAVVEKPLVKIQMHEGSYAERDYSNIISTRIHFNKKMEQLYDQLSPYQIKTIKYNNNLVLAKLALKNTKIKDFICYCYKSKNFKIILHLFRDAKNYLLHYSKSKMK